jgi:hypothetical protein
MYCTFQETVQQSTVAEERIDSPETLQQMVRIYFKEISLGQSHGKIDLGTSFLSNNSPLGSDFYAEYTLPTAVNLLTQNKIKKNSNHSHLQLSHGHCLVTVPTGN